MQRILVFGDSNSVGVCPRIKGGKHAVHPEGDRWPNVMAAALGDGVSVQNASFSGRTTGASPHSKPWRRNGAEFMPHLLKGLEAPDLVIFMLGTNDLLLQMEMTAPGIAKGVGALVNMVQARFSQAAVLVLSPVPVTARGVFEDRFEGAEVRQVTLAYEMHEMAVQKDAYYLDLAPYAVASEEDGLHLNVPAHHAIGAVVAAKVSAIFEQEEPSA